MTTDLAPATERARAKNRLSGLFEHPLLRLAGGTPDIRKRHQGFMRDLRQLVDPTASALLSAPQQERLALNLIAEHRSFGVGARSVQHFKYELLSFLRETATPRLLFELVEVSLKRVDLMIQPDFWMDPLSNGEEMELPRLGRSALFGANSQPASFPLNCAAAAQQALRLAADAMTQGKLDAWSVDDCKVTICMLAVHAMHRSDSRGKVNVDAVVDNLSAFEGVGMSVWKALGEHAHRLCPELHEVYWSDSMRGQILLHLQGCVHSAQLRAAPASASQSEPPVTVAPPGFAIVVREPFPPSSGLTESTTLGRYECLQKPLPVAPMPRAQQLSEILDAMEQEFPWATQAIAHLQRHLTTAALLGVKGLVLPPTLLVGPPGAGKSRFVRRLAQHLALPYMPISLGGASDSKIVAGSARGWASADASPIIQVLAQHRCASALVLLDEIDKIAHRFDGGNIDAQLLGLLEPETARRWRDSYLQSFDWLREQVGSQRGIAVFGGRDKTAFSRTTIDSYLDQLPAPTWLLCDLHPRPLLRAESLPRVTRICMPTTEALRMASCRASASTMERWDRLWTPRFKASRSEAVQRAWETVRSVCKPLRVEEMPSY